MAISPGPGYNYSGTPRGKGEFRVPGATGSGGSFQMAPGTAAPPPLPGENVEQYKRRMEQAVPQDMALARLTVECRQKRHWPGTCIFACAHCEEQDPVHPEGLVFTPQMVFLCKTCFERFSTRKLTAYHVQTSCYDCIHEQWIMIAQKDPTKVKDLRRDDQKLLLRFP